MGAVLQLDPPLRVETPLGPGIALIYESDADDVYWTVALNKSRASVQFRNNQIRFARSYTDRRGISDAAMRKIISGPR